ncbi:NEW3 domain-containing protein [Thermofilum pendens]|uniref:NEW3 domain-containing protein n=1 Tax=Thermofilum pendens TaxID=2269 RepID=UPI00069BFB37|nr:NEW3 domain-containing protein [Thermofilum pendens]
MNVHGVVVDPRGAPISDVSILIFGEDNTLVARVKTSMTGDFWALLAPGTYKASLIKVGYEAKTISFSISGDRLHVELGEITLDYSLSVSVELRDVRASCLSTLRIPVVLAEKGSREETVTLSASAPSGWTAGFYLGDLEVKSIVLSPGQTLKLDLVLKVPYNASGRYNITVDVLGYTLQRRVITVDIEHRDPQLVTSTYLSVKASPGSTVSLDGLEITNKLPDRTSGVVFLLLPSRWSGSILDSTSGNNLYKLSLNPGESVKAKVVLQIPDTAAPGNYTVGVVFRGVDPYFESKLWLNVTVVKGKPLAKLETETPFLNTYAGRSASFLVTTRNIGEGDGVVELVVKGLPPGYSWRIEDLNGNVISKLYLKAGESRQLKVVVSVPLLAEPSVIPFILEANTNYSRVSLPLNLGVMGSYSLEYTTQNFYLEVTSGSSATFQLGVKNTGYSSLTNVRIEVSNVPRGLRVNISPEVVLSLKAQENANFTVTVYAEPDVSAGDYYITLKPLADQLSEDQSLVATRQLHVYVKTGAGAVYIGLGALLALVVLLVAVYRKFGRR